MTLMLEREAELAEPRPMFVAPEWIQHHCVIPDGFRRGAPFRLYDYQLLYIRNFYLVRGDATWTPGSPLLASAFTYRRGLLVGPQKVGKNPLIAAQVCLEGVGPALFAGFAGFDEGYSCAEHGCACGWEYPYDEGEPKGMLWPTPLIQITAFSQESTDNTYGALRPMIELGSLADVIPKTGEEFIRLPGGGRIDAVTSSASSRLGNPTTFTPQDEVGIWTRVNKMERLADTQYRGLAGMGGRASLTTNPWDPAENSVAQTQFESKATDIYRQYTRPPSNLSFANKAERRKLFRIVYPPDVLRDNEPPGHVDLDSIEAEAADLIVRDAHQAMRFFGNIIVAGAGHAADPDLWDSLARPHDVEPGTPIGIGFDGSISDDATILQACTADGYGFLLGAWVRPSGSAFLAWQATHAGKDWSVPRNEVHEAVAAAFQRYRVGKMLCDPPHWWTELGTWTAQYGEDIVDKLDTNQTRQFSPVVDRWRTAITEGTHTHDGNPIIAAHVKASHLQKVRNADASDDGRTQYTLIKGPDRRKIDGAIADCLALEAASTMAPDKPSAYEERGLIAV